MFPTNHRQSTIWRRCPLVLTVSTASMVSWRKRSAVRCSFCPPMQQLPPISWKRAIFLVVDSLRSSPPGVRPFCSPTTTPLADDAYFLCGSEAYEERDNIDIRIRIYHRQTTTSSTKTMSIKSNKILNQEAAARPAGEPVSAYHFLFK